MTLLPGRRLAVAPRFGLEPDWPGRLAVGAGLEEVGGKFFPRGPWRPPAAGELALLVAAPEPPPPGTLPVLGGGDGTGAVRDADGAVALFQIPEHLRAAWWDLLDAAAAADRPVEGFDGFAGQVAEFLAFKRLGLPAGVHAEAVVTAAGERSIRRDPETGSAAGLGPTVAPWSAWPPAGEVVPRLCAVVNLGDEPSGVAFVNLPPPGLAAELATREPAAPPPATLGELVGRFLRARPDYPPVRVRLGPGEGCRLPADGLILDGSPEGKTEPDVLLLLSEDAPARPA